MDSLGQTPGSVFFTAWSHSYSLSEASFSLSMEGKVCPPAWRGAPTISRWLFETECRRFQQMASNYLRYAKVLKGAFVSSNLRGSCTWHDVSGMCINVPMSAFIPSTVSAMSFITDNCLWYEWNFLEYCCNRAITNKPITESRRKSYAFLMESRNKATIYIHTHFIEKAMETLN